MASTHDACGSGNAGAACSTEPGAGNRTVDNYIARLRGKVEPVPAAPRYILTVHGTGYKLA